MPKVTFNKSGNSIELPNNSSLLDLEDIENNEVPFGCRAAACSTCTIDVILGMQNINTKTEDEQDLLDDFDLNGDKRRLACQCVIHGDITIEPLN